MLPVRVKVPELVLVIPKPVPDTTPLKVRPEPATATVLSATSATAPDKLDVPVEADKVPPFKLSASPPTATPWKSSTAPLATAVPAAVDPKPAAFVTAKVPADTVVVPL